MEGGGRARNRVAAFPHFSRPRTPRPSLRYPSGTYLDNLATAAAWLHRRTGEKAFLDQAKEYYTRMRNQEAGSVYRFEHAWCNCAWGVSMLLATITGEQKYSDDMRAFAERWIQGGSPISYTGTGLAFMHQA